MDLYKQMYYKLFNRVTTALGEEDVESIKMILKNAQIETEEMYIAGDED